MLSLLFTSAALVFIIPALLIASQLLWGGSSFS